VEDNDNHHSNQVGISMQSIQNTSNTSMRGQFEKDDIELISFNKNKSEV